MKKEEWSTMFTDKINMLAITAQTALLKMDNVMGAGWDLTNFLKKSTTQVKLWGGSFLTLIGFAGVIWAAFQIVTGLMSHGKKQVSYGTNVGLLLIAGALSVSGLDLVSKIAAGGKQTITDLGSTIDLFRGLDLDLGTIVLFVQNGLLF